MALLRWTYLALFLSSLIEFSRGAPIWMGRHMITTYDELAVCNDGSESGYYFRKGGTESKPSPVWVVYLEGGLWCYDEGSCNMRWASGRWSMTSMGWPEDVQVDGIFDSEPSESAFTEANLVYVTYCSSDAWMGDIGASNETFGYNFRGSRILSTVLVALVKDQGLGSVPANLLISGCSSGAIGAMVNADRIATVLETLQVTNVNVSAMLDSPLWLDIDPLDPTVVTLQSETQSIYALVDPTNVLGNCARLYSGDEGWKCLFGQYRMPLLTTPYLLSQNQFDSFQLTYSENVAPPYSGVHQLSYANEFQQEMLTTLAKLPQRTQHGSCVYSRACWEHCVSDNSLFWGGNSSATPHYIAPPPAAPGQGPCLGTACGLKALAEAEAALSMAAAKAPEAAPTKQPGFWTWPYGVKKKSTYKPQPYKYKPTSAARRKLEAAAAAPAKRAHSCGIRLRAPAAAHAAADAELVQPVRRALHMLGRGSRGEAAEPAPAPADDLALLSTYYVPGAPRPAPAAFAAMAAPTLLQATAAQAAAPTAQKKSALGLHQSLSASAQHAVLRTASVASAAAAAPVGAEAAAPAAPAAGPAVGSVGSSVGGAAVGSTDASVSSYAAMPTLNTVLTQWFFSGVTTSYVEACTGFACAAQCPMASDSDSVAGGPTPAASGGGSDDDSS